MSPPLSETEEQQKAGSSSAADVVDEDGSGTSEDIDAEAIDLMGQGKRNLVVGDPPAAVQCLQEACALLAGKYGEMADECGEAYYQYGCALLELASLENGVLGNALQGVPDESADSDDDDDDAAGDATKKPSNVESADTLEEKEREEIIHQVQDALEAACESEESEREEKEKDEGDEDGEKKEGEGETEEEEEEMETGEGGEDKDEESGEKDGEKKKEGEKKEVEKEESKEDATKGKEEESAKPEEGKDEKKESAKPEEGKDEKKEDVKEDKEKEAKKVEGGKDEKVKDGKKEDEVKKQEHEKEEKDGKPKDEEKDDKAKSQKKDDEDDDADDGAGPSKDKADDEAGPSTEKADGEGEEKEDEDDVPNFQLAWEMLELARLIISRQESKDCQLKVSQIHLKLGELGLETEQYAQSIIDFSSCLTIQKKYLEADSRQIAGTHYNLGLALSFAQQFDDSIENYRLSKELIEKRLKDLDQVVSAAEGKGKAKADESDPLVSAAKEMDELKELLPDVVSKLEDAKEMKSQAGAAGGSSDGAGPSSSTSSGFAPSSSGFDQSSSGFDQSSSSAPVQQISVKRPEAAQVSDISHLVRRKRKGADEEEGEEAGTTADSKRSRQEESADKTPSEATTNGSGDAKAVPNGHANGESNGHANGESNGHVNGDVVANGDAKLSPEKPSEIKTKKLPTDQAPAAMETA